MRTYKRTQSRGQHCHQDMEKLHQPKKSPLCCRSVLLAPADLDLFSVPGSPTNRVQWCRAWFLSFRALSARVTAWLGPSASGHHRTVPLGVDPFTCCTVSGLLPAFGDCEQSGGEHSSMGFCGKRNFHFSWVNPWAWGFWLLGQVYVYRYELNIFRFQSHCAILYFEIITD